MICEFENLKILGGGGHCLAELGPLSNQIVAGVRNYRKWSKTGRLLAYRVGVGLIRSVLRPASGGSHVVVEGFFELRLHGLEPPFSRSIG